MVNVEAFKAAARAAIVMPSVFAFASLVIGPPQVSLFAAFGSFAVLVLVEFGGSRRARLAAYTGFAAVGVGLIALGTLCSRDPWIAAAAMAVVAFAVLFSGGFSGYLAARYGLTPIGQHNGKLPVTANGGTWTAQLPGGLTRTISWHAGNSFVTVRDKRSSGTTTTQVPVGHELPLAPFKR